MGWLTAILAGVLTGILSGFGVGGGTLLLIYLTTFAGIAQNQAQGINLLYFLPSAAAALAAWAATGLDTALLRRCFGGFLLVVGLRELFRKG